MKGLVTHLLGGQGDDSGACVHLQVTRINVFRERVKRVRHTNVVRDTFHACIWGGTLHIQQ